MSNYFKQNYRLLLTLLFFVITLGCAKDVDVYEELSRYEEPNLDESEDVESDETSDSPENEEETSEEEETDEEFQEESNLNHPVSGAFYVTPNGSSSNDGSSESTAWSLSHAVNSAQAGDVVYIKAGTYNGPRLTIRNSGTPDEPIIFMGYRDVPGDIDATVQNLAGPETRGRRGTTVLAGGVEFNYKTQPSSSEMPFLRKDYVRDETALSIEGDFIEIQNIMISGYSTGIYISSSSSNAKIWNCIFHEQGNMNVGMRDLSHPDRWKGIGILNKGGQNVNVQFCSFLNCEEDALQFQGANSGIVSNNVVYSYNQINGTDYMFLITRNGNTYSQNLTFEYNKCERVPGVAHGGHGFVVKNGGLNNTFRYWEVIHTNIEVNFINADGNLFEKGTLRGGFYDYGDELTYILVTNGAQNNTFKDIVIDGTWGGVVMHDYNDGASNDPNIDGALSGNRNNFINLIVKNCKYGVIFSEFGVNSPTGAINNNFINCTFYDVEYGIRSYMRNSGNAFYNSSFTTKNGFLTNVVHNLNPNTIFQNCHFNGAVNPGTIAQYQGGSNLGGDPMFQNPGGVINHQFDVSGLQLQSNSPLIDAGLDVTGITTQASRNFNGNTRNKYNIGAF